MHIPEQHTCARKAKKTKASNIKCPGLDKTDKPRKRTLNSRKHKTKNSRVLTLFFKPLLIDNFKIRIPIQRR
jgi:hypothetical protein